MGRSGSICKEEGHVTPQNPGSVEYPSTRGIQVDVGLPDATSENRAESPLYGELYPITKPAYNLSQVVQYMQYISNISNMHTNYDPTIYIP